MFNIFILNSPLQYLNALEAIHQLALKHCVLLLKKSGSDFNIRLCDNLHRRYGHYFDESYQIEHQRGWITEKSLNTDTKDIIHAFRNNVRHVFSGNSTESLNNYLINCLNADEIIYLDDGVQTIISVFQERKVLHVSDSIKKLIGLNTYKNYGERYFTAYHNMSWPDHVTVIPNRYNLLETMYAGKTYDESCLFILSPLVEFNLMRYDDFKRMIIFAKNLIGGPIRYALHRYSTPSMIEDLLESDDSLIDEYDFPIEIQLTDNGIIPGKIVGFFTTALLNIKMVSEAHVIYFDVPHSDKLTIRQAREYMNLLTQEGAEVVKV